MVEHLFCELEGFTVDFVTSLPIPQHEEQSHKRVLPPNCMTKHFHQSITASGAIFHLQEKLRAAARCWSKQSERTRAKPHGV